MPEVAPNQDTTQRQAPEPPLLAVAELPKKVLTDEDLEDQFQEFFAQLAGGSQFEMDTELKQVDSAAEFPDAEASSALTALQQWGDRVQLASFHHCPFDAQSASAPQQGTPHEAEFASHVERIRRNVEHIRNIGDLLENNKDASEIRLRTTLHRTSVAPSEPKPSTLGQKCAPTRPQRLQVSG